MAYDRYDTRENDPRARDHRDHRDHHEDRDHGRPGGRHERGFFERASEQVASWFGDDEADRRRRQDEQAGGRDPRGNPGGNRDRHADPRGSGRDENRGYGRDSRPDSPRSGRDERFQGTAWPSSERDYNREWRDNVGWERDDEWRGGRNDQGGRDGYRPMTGDYGRAERERSAGRDYGASMAERNERDNGNLWDRDQYRSSSRAGTRDQSDRSQHDPHYRSWRDQHMSELDRDYEDYHRENRSKFEQEFTSWRERRNQKRGLLGQVREHMEVVGKDDQHVGTVDKVAGDRIILAKSDPESGGAHHSLNCHAIDRVDGNRVILDCPAGEARRNWRDESRGRALFEREDQGDMGNRALNHAFGGTYR